MGSWKFDTGATGLETYMRMNIWDEVKSQLYRDCDNWDYQKRNPGPSAYAANAPAYFGLWTHYGWGGLDPAGAYGLDLCPMNNPAVAAPPAWDRWQISHMGSASPRYISGIAQDDVGNVLPGATVKAFITSTDALDGQTTSGSDGSYNCPCYTVGVNHYIVVYKAGWTGGQDYAAASVNTLVPQ